MDIVKTGRSIATNLALPKSTSPHQSSDQVQTNGSVVIVGANGSGKTRLGSWIEFRPNLMKKVHRIAAQKSLTMPESSQASAFNKAEKELFYGTNFDDKQESLHSHHRTHSRWHNKPNTSMLNDYQHLMVYLFTEDYEKSIKYRHEAKHAEHRVIPPETRLDIIKRIWENVLPQKELHIGAGKVETSIKATLHPKYNAAEMSDGERVIFYLIGQALAAPNNGIIIIDEPELHLHKSIQAKLWDEIEAERSDCLFIYLTHDLEFASSRLNANKIWLKSFDGSHWDWQEIPDNNEISEEVLFTILGSRKPILFIEGTKDSLDQFLFRQLYPEHTIISNGSCSDVIHATQSFSSMRQLHNLECRGIVDRDHRTEEKIQYLSQKSIFVLNVSEIENLLLAEEALRFFADSLLIKNIDEIIEKIKTLLFSELEKDKQKLNSSICVSKTEELFRAFDTKAEGKEQLENSFQNFLNKVDISSIYDEIETETNRILLNRDYESAIKFYNNKGMIYQIGPLFGMGPKEFVDYSQRLISSKSGEPLRQALKKYVPDIG